MNPEAKTYKTNVLIRQQSRALVDISNMSEHYKLAAMSDPDTDIQGMVNRLILLEGELGSSISEERLLLISSGSKVMAQRPALAPVIAAGFAVTSR